MQLSVVGEERIRMCVCVWVNEFRASLMISGSILYGVFGICMCGVLLV